ncbi:hypothetical protein K7B06_30025 [Streptomyces erythrochromogenes]|nr:hypothetical protein [Streptomyces erythrochromogenes]
MTTEPAKRRRHPAAVSRIAVCGGSVAVTLLLVAAFAADERAKEEERHRAETERRAAREQADRQARPAPPPDPAVRVVTLVRRYVNDPAPTTRLDTVPSR